MGELKKIPHGFNASKRGRIFAVQKFKGCQRGLFGMFLDVCLVPLQKLMVHYRQTFPRIIAVTRCPARLFYCYRASNDILRISWLLANTHAPSILNGGISTVATSPLGRALCYLCTKYEHSLRNNDCRRIFSPNSVNTTSKNVECCASCHFFL